MSELIVPMAEWSAAIIEALGIGIIVIAALYTVLLAALRLGRRENMTAIMPDVRQRLGRGILLGLEFLVAADIIHTVAVELTFETVGVLATIVLIRTFLSFTLDLELTGKWPWQQTDKSHPSP
ncbi:DUF1622 domain-containing protein [Hydrocarboniclastica marina]|uniref:DUF1622 domain-containing protein n=1 Tax=Hydrocarboniclastica marina TaxID=2259620 RepID=A0A4P7XGB6_9ALTE|nr:DUF1622 domain-containing protein [Hydrocarboniclastica marina]MAL99296.1 hypothetical protein [Alteromonadaceae bacterium]QCF26038.1 DUF1622 domain-containing protein [Hydrocarboniclastica marina]|tara:strand:- start:4079 stop:4447 length:369 start_codon:yes stop_codon:yes gene_type:complete